MRFVEARGACRWRRAAPAAHRGVLRRKPPLSCRCQLRLRFCGSQPSAVARRSRRRWPGAEAPDGVIFRFAGEDEGAGRAAPRGAAAAAQPSEAQAAALSMVASAAADSTAAWAAALEAAVADGAAAVVVANSQRAPLDKALSAVNRLEALLGVNGAPRPAAAAPRGVSVKAVAASGTQVIRARSKLDALQEGARSSTPLVLALAAADAFFASLKSAAQLERERADAAAKAAASEARAEAARAAAVLAKARAAQPTPAQLARGSLASAAFLGLAIALAATTVSSEAFTGGVVMLLTGGAAALKAAFAAAQRNATANAQVAAQQAAEAQAAAAQAAAQPVPVPVPVQSSDGGKQ